MSIQPVFGGAGILGISIIPFILAIMVYYPHPVPLIVIVETILVEASFFLFVILGIYFINKGFNLSSQR